MTAHLVALALMACAPSSKDDDTGDAHDDTGSGRGPPRPSAAECSLDPALTGDVVNVRVGPDGSVYVSEFGNHRIQRFTPEGQFLGCWGTHGRGEGQLFNPWALVCDTRGRIHVLDTNNHRVQTIRI